MKNYQFFIAAAIANVATAIIIHFNICPVTAGSQFFTALIELVIAAVFYKYNK